MDSSAPVTLMALWRQWRAGDIARETALAAAVKPAVTESLSIARVRILNAFATDLVWRDWEGAVVAQELTLAAVKALPPGAQSTAMRQAAELEWLEVVTRAVWQVPDGRLFRNTVGVGEELAKESGVFGNRSLEAEALHRLGLLHLEPYTSGRSTADYPLQLRDWRARLQDHYGDKVAGLAAEEAYPPEPAQALERAASYLRRAAELSTATDKARALKALGEAIEWRGILNPPLDREEVTRCYLAALESFDPNRHPNECAALIGSLQRHSQPFPETYLNTLLAIPLADYEQGTDHLRATDLGVQLLRIVAQVDPHAALVRSQQLLALLQPRSDQQAMHGVYKQQLALLVAVYAEDESIQLLRHALLAPNENAEAKGLEWLGQFETQNPGLSQEFAGAILWLRAALHVGEAANAYQAGRLAEAAEHDGAALREFMALGFESEVMGCLRKFGELLRHERADNELATHLIATLTEVSIPVQAMLGEKATRMIVATCRELIRRITGSREVDATLVLMVLHIAKGLRFAAAATKGARYDWRTDPEGLVLLEAVADAQKEVPLREFVDDDSALDATMFLAAYVGPGERGSGNTARDILDNRQRAYDEHVNRRILEQAKASLDLHPLPADVESAIDDRTVLVNYYLGQSPDGMLAVYILVYTKDGPWMAAGYAKDLPSGYATLKHNGREARVTLAGMEIQSLLESVTASPFGAVVDAEAARLLEAQANNYLGTLPQFLALQRKKGRDHLCLVPHGPLHFHPLHLLGPPDKPLAEDWIVTYLPNLGLLTRRTASGAPASARRKHKVAAIGVSFAKDGLHGQEAIPQAITETSAIAKLFNVKPVHDDAATETAFIQALQQSRYIHVATHGELCLHAPAFHRLYLTPDDRSDGIINAYEILALDLGHVECLTLSACETSLGRFDEADNLRGLPASFFTAGVATVVGTLWRVETNTSEYFFTRFYKAVKKGETRLDAFADAQRATRKKHPKYRDWGAFYLAGDWR